MSNKRNKLGQFLKGLMPWNKGKKINLSPETQFKTGENHTGEKHPSWRGGVQVMSKDCDYVWNGTNKRKRKPRTIWEEKNGPVPEGMVIYHIDGDKKNDALENLEIITRSELLKRNRKKI